MRDWRQTAFFLDLFLNNSTLDIYYIRRSILNSIEENLDKFHGVFLDLGCGDMPYKPLLLSNKTKIEKYIGIDIASGKIDYDIKPDYFWDGNKIPLADASVDCVMSTEVFEHCPDLLSVMKEIKRVLKPGGFVFFTVPFLWPLHEVPYDEFRYTPYSLERIIRNAGFDKVSLKPTGGWNESLGQMLGLWVTRSPMNFHLRKVLKVLFWPLVWLLVRKRKKKKTIVFEDSMMITGITGTAYKGE
ncbi:class I SAM-dependent methyltransferase [Niastella caeni]|uniref:Class I SAM-dependent methyltransferase n=1 Tax=Niastella caeni TaxID=2569763 RepID=A0A4S8I084_9BACT|nr:class I SAM-dependent methyltransferase [Niastella caeni]THU41528.1 class I SAM-dependent methyltransferase [Niastella caeni]